MHHCSQKEKDNVNEGKMNKESKESEETKEDKEYFYINCVYNFL